VPQIANFNRINYSPTFFNSDNKELKYLTNSSFIWASEPDKALFVNNLNLYGFRDVNWSTDKSKDKVRVMFIGDSFVEGFMAKDDETIPYQFNTLANTKNMNVEAMNFGIGGTDLTHYFKLIRDAVPLFKPDYLVLVLIANDMQETQFNPSLLENPIQAEINSYFKPRVYKIISDLINGKSIAKVWNGKAFNFFSAVPSKGNPWSDETYERECSKFVIPVISNAMKKGTFNPFMVNEYDVYAKSLREPIDITKQLNTIKNYSEQFCKSFMLVYIPSRNQVSDYYLQYQKDYCENKQPQSLMGDEYQIHAGKLREVTNLLGIKFLDLTESIKAEEINGKHLYWNYDEHFNSRGYSLSAGNIFEWWYNNIER
jgi:hypothetical protein